MTILLLLVQMAAPAEAQTTCSQTLQSLIDAAPAGAIINVPACTYHETVTIAKPLTLDGGGRAVIDGDWARQRWVWIASSDVTVRGFIMRNTATISQQGALGTQAGVRNVWIDKNDLCCTRDGEPLGFGGTTSSKVTGNNIHDGGALGMDSYASTGLLVQGNHVHHNNTVGADPFWGAGGYKAVSITSSQIVDNEFDHNVGPAIWCDIACDGVLIARNTIHDQTYNPIFYEISRNAEIRDNVITNAAGVGVWGCIVSSSSVSVYVHHNTCTDSEPLRAQLDNRTDNPAGAGTGNRLEDNRLVRPVPNEATSWWQWDANGPLVPGRNGNTDLRNVIGSVAPTPTPVPPRRVRCEFNIRLDGVEQGWKTC